MSGRSLHNAALPQTLSVAIVITVAGLSLAGFSAGPTGAFAHAGLIGVATTLALWALSARRALRTAHAERRRSEDVAEMALRDPLTALPNRAAFFDALDRRLAILGTADLAVLYADLDHFKAVNDRHGHEAGDRLLTSVARDLAATVTPGDMITRIGGDEFAMLLDGDDALARAEATAIAMIQAVRRPHLVDNSTVTVGVSIGIAAGAEPGEDGAVAAAELLRRADVALYSAKRESRMNWRRYDRTMDAALSHKRALIGALGGALDRGELSLALQPVYDARAGRVVAAEALLRWTNRELGAVPPARFIPLAEESGQIFDIGRFVARRALGAARDLGGLPVSINVSPAQFTAADFTMLIQRAIDDGGVAADRLRIEITEAALLADAGRAQSTIRELRELGIGVTLDDFGLGYSSLVHLQRFAFDGVKLDPALLATLATRPQAARMLRALIDLAHSLDMSVTAEGIESAEQTRMLQLLGCDYLQGYFLGRPTSLDRLKSDIDVDIATIVAADAVPLVEPGRYAS